MGFRIGSERAGHWRRPIRAIGSSAQSAFPATNVLEPQHPYRQARTSSTLATTSYFGVDLGATGTVTAVIVGNVNVASVQVQAHSLDTWTSPTHTSGEELTDTGIQWLYLNDDIGIVRITAVTDADTATATTRPQKNQGAK